MKNLNDLFQLVAQTVRENNNYNNWFIDYSGHVNKITIRYYDTGWKSGDICHDSIKEELTQDGIQAAYWFIKSRLKG